MITGSGTFGVNQAQQNCSYTYNSIGNLTNKCGAVLSYGDANHSYGDANHPSAVTNHSVLAKNYTYDANGNMLTRGNQTLTWNIDNRVSRIAISGGGSTQMEYDYSGMRVKKSTPAITLYPFASYEIDPNGTTTKFINIGGEAFASKKKTTGGTETQYFYHNDHLGSVNVITDLVGTRVQLNEYDPWGAVSRAAGTIDPDQRFTGQKLDPETGLYYYGGRYYDVEIGRFVSADPFIQSPLDPQNFNRFTYVRNNPQNLVDPDGYFHQVKKKKPSFWKRFGGMFIGIIASVFTAGLASAASAAAVAAGEIAASAATSGAAIATMSGAIGGFVGGAVSTHLNGGNFLQNAFGGAIFGGIMAGGLGGGIFGGVGFGPGTNPSSLGIFAADVANASIRGFVVGTIASVTYGEKFSNALRHGLLSAGIHAGGVTVNTAIGHIVGYIRSGGNGPTVIQANGQSSVYYDVPGGRPGSFGNVISGDADWLAQQTPIGGQLAGYPVRTHEIFHGAQSGVLGIGYGILHGVSQLLSAGLCGNTHSCNALERFLHPYPNY